MAFPLVDYKLLTESINLSIVSLLISHQKLEAYTTDPNIIKEAVAKLDIPRRTQVQFLLETMELIDRRFGKDDDNAGQQKARVFNAAAFYVREQIRISYEKSYTALLTQKENSTFYIKLNTSLNITKDNEPKEGDLIDMYGALSKFMEEEVFEGGDCRNRLKQNHPYNFLNYEVGAEITDLIKKVASYKVTFIQNAVKAELKSKTTTKDPKFYSASSRTPAAAQPNKTTMKAP